MIRPEVVRRNRNMAEGEMLFAWSIACLGGLLLYMANLIEGTKDKEVLVMKIISGGIISTGLFMCGIGLILEFWPG